MQQELHNVITPAMCCCGSVCACCRDTLGFTFNNLTLNLETRAADKLFGLESKILSASEVGQRKLTHGPTLLEGAEI